MKRSLMLQKYTDILKMYGYVDNELMSAEGLASVLLGVAEHHGMLPPEVFFQPNRKGCSCTMRESCPSCGGWCSAWEPEND